MKVTGDDGKFVLLFADGGYSSRSWQELILPGISCSKKEELKSLLWIREQCEDKNCLEGMGNHDPNVIPHSICL